MKRLLKRTLLMCLCLILMGSSLCVKAEEVTQEKRIIYLTFDDGPSEYTEELLNLLKAHNMKVTFFLLETEMKRFPEAISRMIEEGHAIGVHGVSHEKEIFYRGTMGPLNEMEKANDTLMQIAGRKTTLARTPYGSSPYLTTAQEKVLSQHDYVIWDWNIDSRDWSYRNAQKTFSNTTKMILKSNNEPKVVLFHDMKSVVETMKLFINWMEENNYTSEAITNELQPVKLYHRAKRG